MNLIDQWNRICADQRRINSDKVVIKEKLGAKIPEMIRLRGDARGYAMSRGGQLRLAEVEEAWDRALRAARRGDVSNTILALRAAEAIEDELRQADPRTRRAKNFARAALELVL